MEPTVDKQWAHKYLLDPLTAPEPSDETGPGSHFTREDSSPKIMTPSSKSATSNFYPTPPNSASPTKSTFHPSNPYSPSPSHRQAAFAGYSNSHSRSSSSESGNEKARRRGSSLGERFPGDMSHRPLDQLRKEAKAAHRSPHLRKQHLPGADTIDFLDRTMLGGAYHHEGPYDATLLARNTHSKISPVEATRRTNEEALRATPRENIKDSLVKHVPLHGTAVIPSGFAGPDGQVMIYEGGADLMREEDAPGGAYKRWDGVKYHPEDLKGKGEPSFSIERALQDHDKLKHRRIVSESNSKSYETQPASSQYLRPGANRLRSISGDGGYVDREGVAKPTGTGHQYGDFENDIRRSNSTGMRFGEGLKKRFGSLRKSKKATPGEARS